MTRRNSLGTAVIMMTTIFGLLGLPGYALNTVADTSKAACETVAKTQSDAFYNQVSHKYDRGDFQGVVNDCTAALKADPRDQVALFYRGLALMQLNSFESAISDFSRLIAIDDGNPLGFIGRGICYLALGEGQKGLNDLRTAQNIFVAMNDAEGAQWVADIINEVTNA